MFNALEKYSILKSLIFSNLLEETVGESGLVATGVLEGVEITGGLAVVV